MSPRLASVLLVALAAVFAHLPSAAGEFLYDDQRFIVHNRALEEADWVDLLTDPRTTSHGTGLGEDGLGISADIFRPLRTVLFAAERRAFGLDPRPWHALSLVLHAVNALLVLLLLEGLVGRAPPAALLGALLFAVHPVGVESVGWISSQGDLLSLTFLLLALWVLRRPGAARTALGAGLAALACFAKESAVVVPGLLVLRDLARPESDGVPRRTTWLRTGLLALVVLGYMLVRAQALPGELGQVQGPGSGPVDRSAGFLAALAWYAGALVWPSGFRFETDLPLPLSFAEPAVVVGAGLLLTLLALGAWALRRPAPRPVLFATWGALAALVPVSQVLVPLKTLAAERFLYPALPCVAAGLAALGAVLLRRRWPGPAWALLLLLLPLVVVSRSRAEAWRSEEQLWEAVRADRPSNWRAYEGLGYAYLAKGRYQDGERAYTTYLEANPFDGRARRRMADYLRGLSRSLVSNDPAVEAQKELRERRRQMQALEVLMLESALNAWGAVGYVAGRGSAALALDTQKRLRDAALDLGDLNRAKGANDVLIARAGVDPKDPAAVEANAPLDERLCRWFMAWIALTTPKGDLTGAALQDRYAQRSRALTDVRLDPSRFDQELVVLMAEPLERLTAEQAAARDAAPTPAQRARLSRRLGQLRMLRAEVLEALGKREEAARLRMQLAAEARLGEGAGGP